jgi:HEAT repeat protein
MRRTLPGLAATLLAVFLLPATARPADDDPKIGDYSASYLINLVKTGKEVKKRRAAVNLLKELGLRSPKGILTVLGALKDDADPEVREAAALAAGDIAQKAEETKDPKDQRRFMVEVRDGCLEALRTALQKDRDAKDPKADAPRARVRAASASALGRVGTELLTLKKEEEREQTLIAGFKAAIPLLSDALKDPSPEVRAAAAESLGRLSEYAREALPELVEAFKDKKADRFVRGHAAVAIGRIGGDGARAAVPALSEAVTDKDAPADVRRSAATALGALKADGAGGAAALGQALKDGSVDVRRAAAGSLAQIGPDARAALDAVKEAAKDQDKFVRAQALHVLGLMTQDAADVVRILIAATDDQILEVRLAAIEALGSLGPSAKLEATVKVLTRLKTDAQGSVREAATEALKKVEKE